MTVVLDGNGLSALAADRARLRQIPDRGGWPPIVPAVVLAEALTGDRRRDFHENRLLKLCDIRAIDEALGRHAASLRTATARRRISATDAIVVATADRPGGVVVLTSDPADLRALAFHAVNPVRVERV
ncbi:MAG: type II toxin-antitoxin system VapC family toxin [Acidimicrobiales bacterium]